MPWSPQVGSQLDFLELRQCVPEAFIGGDRGGGKSAVLMADAALAKIEQGKHFRGILFRRHLGEFDTLLERSKEVFYGHFPESEAKYLSGTQRWEFKDGSSLQFAMMEHDTDVDKHLGIEYCVAVGTGVRTFFGNRRIEDLERGDRVETLDGEGVVQLRTQPRLAECARFETYDEEGQFIGAQVAPLSHPVLTALGWRSYASLLESDSTGSEAIRREARTLPSLTVPVVLAAPDRTSGSPTDSASTTESGVLCRWRGPSCETYEALVPPASEMSAGLRPVTECEQRLLGRIALRVGAGDVACAPPDPGTLEGSLVDYRAGRHFCGEPLPAPSGSDPASLRPRAGAGARSHWGDTPDGSGSVQTRSAVRSAGDGFQFLHPYGGGWTRLAVGWRFGTCVITPVGEREVCDISVRGGNHYIASRSLLVNANTWIGFDELPQWPNPRPYLMMLASLRTARKGVFVRVRSTGNPGGPGISWIKKRFQIPDLPEDCARASGRLIEDPETGLDRVFVYSRLKENRALLDADPFYQQRLAASVEGDPELRKAWIDADFSALFGQYFKVFDPNVHCVDPTDLWDGGLVPANWRILGDLDYGENSPTSFGLWAVSDEGLHVRIAEHYEGGEYASYHAGKIKDLCQHNPYTRGRMPQVVWADSALWNTRANQGGALLNRTVADIFKAEAGLRLRPSMKGPNSRVQGWRYMKELLAQRKLLYLSECSNFEDEMKSAVFADTGDREDIDKMCADHALDGARYLVMASRRGHSVPPPAQASYATFRYIKDRNAGKTTDSFMVPPQEKVDFEALAVP